MLNFEGKQFKNSAWYLCGVVLLWFSIVVASCFLEFESLRLADAVPTQILKLTAR